MTKRGTGYYFKLTFFGLLMLYYTLCFWIDISKHNFCGATSVDFCAYWSTGRLLNEHGISSIYNLDVLREYQSPIYPRPFENNPYFLLIPFPYLSVFALPFSLFARIKLEYSYILWAAINYICLLFYLRFFVREITGKNIDLNVMLAFAVSIPVFFNLSYGQLNVWLGIFAGEFYRLWVKGRQFKGGLWLSGLLLKPQTLILIVPYLLIKREFKALAGFALGTSLIGGISALLMGKQGMLEMATLLAGSSSGKLASSPLRMMNWRMFALHFDNFLGTNLAMPIIIVGSLITLLFFWYILQKVPGNSTQRSLFSIFAVLVTTMLVTWHAHTSQIITALPFFAALVTEGRISKKTLNIWFLLPAVANIMILAFLIVPSFTKQPPFLPNIPKFINGFVFFGLNYYLLANGAKNKPMDPISEPGIITQGTNPKI